MYQILQNIPGTRVILDVIIITVETDQEHLENMRQVRERLSDYNIRAETTKCEFVKESIAYCGHRIYKQGQHKKPYKIDAVVNVPSTTNANQLRAYLGLLGYYHRFLPNLSTDVGEGKKVAVGGLKNARKYSRKQNA